MTAPEASVAQVKQTIGKVLACHDDVSASRTTTKVEAVANGMPTFLEQLRAAADTLGGMVAVATEAGTSQTAEAITKNAGAVHNVAQGTLPSGALDRMDAGYARGSSEFDRVNGNMSPAVDVMRTALDGLYGMLTSFEDGTQQQVQEALTAAVIGNLAIEAAQGDGRVYLASA